jgi:hypothetical protein
MKIKKETEDFLLFYIEKYFLNPIKSYHKEIFK